MDQVEHFTCKDAFQRLNDYVDRELTPLEMRQVQIHLEVCAQCAQAFELEADVLQQIRETLQRIRMPENLMARISSAIMKS